MQCKPNCDQAVAYSSEIRLLEASESDGGFRRERSGVRCSYLSCLLFTCSRLEELSLRSTLPSNCHGSGLNEDDLRAGPLRDRAQR